MADKKYFISSGWLDSGNLRIKLSAIEALALDVDNVIFHMGSGEIHMVRGCVLNPENGAKAAADLFFDVCRALTPDEQTAREQSCAKTYSTAQSKRTIK